MAHQPDPLAQAHQTGREWLTTIAHHLGTEDRHYAYRVLRAWLHLVRDRLTIDSAAHFAAQLPEVLRGVYYDGWVPSRVPIRYGVASFTKRFADEADVRAAEVAPAAGAVSAGLNALCSPGQLDHVLALMPSNLRGELQGETFAPEQPRAATAEDLRLNALECRMDALTEAVNALARALEQPRVGDPEVDRAAKEAQRILMAPETVQT